MSCIECTVLCSLHLMQMIDIIHLTAHFPPSVLIFETNVAPATVALSLCEIRLEKKIVSDTEGNGKITDLTGCNVRKYFQVSGSHPSLFHHFHWVKEKYGSVSASLRGRGLWEAGGDVINVILSVVSSDCLSCCRDIP